jgi:pSer/pThr/pTyr-binding forkhead associated (FHA) protein
MSESPEQEIKRVVVPPNAFLIVNSQVFPLDQEVINIGRSLENHLVIDDPSVSRAHAQLIAIKNHFMVFDQNSTGGTFVNGKRISRTVLNSGDIISLAAVSMLYVEDSPGLLSKSWEQTRPLGQEVTDLEENPHARRKTEEPEPTPAEEEVAE